MKYLVLEPSRYTLDYRIKEFDTPEELSEYVMRTGVSNVVLAQRVALEVRVCAWTPAAATPEKVCD